MKQQVSINTYIQQYENLKSRKPIKFSELRSFVIDKIGRNIPSSTIRNIFIGNDDFYKNEYLNIGRNVYVPKEKFDKENSVLKYISDGKEYMWDDLSLGYQLGINVQNITKPSCIIFTDELSQKAELFEKILFIKTINIKNKKQIKAFKQLYKIKAFSNDIAAIIEYINKNNITLSNLKESYYLLKNNRDLLKNELNNIENILWKVTCESNTI